MPFQSSSTLFPSSLTVFGVKQVAHDQLEKLFLHAAFIQALLAVKGDAQALAQALRVNERHFRKLGRRLADERKKT